MIAIRDIMKVESDKSRHREAILWNQQQISR